MAERFLRSKIVASRDHDKDPEFGWRRPAPKARRAAMTLYAWQAPSVSYFAALAVACPFILAAFFAPALLSLSPTIDMLAPIAQMRGALSGEVAFETTGAPFYLLLLAAGDFFADSPGRIYLIAKALGAIFVTASMAYFSISRLPIIQGAALTGALAGFVASPFGGPAELALAIFLSCSFCFVAASADTAPGRARFDGVLAGFCLFALWLFNPVFSLAAFLVLSACPFLSGPNGLTRYASTLAIFALMAGLIELAAPGINIARAEAASGTLSMSIQFQGGEGALGLGGVSVSAVLVLAMTAVFGGREHIRAAAAAGALGLVAFVAARFADANALPVFIFVATIAAFSVASPFYDGLFRNHDRASVSVALGAAVLPVFWAVTMILHAGGQFALQHQTTALAPDNIRSELALVQPGGSMIASWIEEGRFTTVEAREFFALAPVDQSAMLLEAVGRAKQMSADGHAVAILAGTDAACVIGDNRTCHADSNDAAAAAGIVFVPRFDLGAEALKAKGRAEALLYTEFKLVEETPFWEIWERRSRVDPTGLSLN